MISAQNAFRVCREGKPVRTFPDHALARAVRPRNPNDLCIGVTYGTLAGRLSWFRADCCSGPGQGPCFDDHAVRASRMRTMDTASADFPADGPSSAEARQWRNVLTQFRDQLQQICESDLVCSDQEAQRIIIGMVRCQNMTEVDAQMDRLVIRIGELLAIRSGDPSELTRLVTQARERGRAALTRHGKQHKFNDDADRPIRTVVKL
jgi:hypothetical protein